MASTFAAPIVLMASPQDRPLESVLAGMPHEVYHVRSGALAIECAPALRPDVIMLALELPDMSGIETCRSLHAHPRLAHNVPILIMAPEPPTPEQRVAALDAGAWDFVRYPNDLAELSLKVQAYVQAKRNIDTALAETLGEPETFVHSRAGLARRARELGALMTRIKGSLACLVFVVEQAPPDSRMAATMARAARISDVVGELRATECAVVAPATDEAGAVLMARRMCEQLQRSGRLGPAAALNAGYAAVTNVGYRPVDPIELLARAAAAARAGRPEPGHAWLRRYDVSVHDSSRLVTATPPLGGRRSGEGRAEP